ncbi:protoporphyrinogen oxidase HemJ [Campylobacter sp. US33a]|uniref:protoporphyrinogen oxidase HemJ n=1 Tax=Campylobacter sp. US33a TaxID=2498120 RepID=UPI0010679857|nr:protoporphyrinogen oxidase HemJ [Campylobacter sp. US33a]TEY03493.1 protoporphyrinogen oxidase HemJ [Campylobacter sp. US33a]
MEIINEYYQWVKWLHYLAFISWMAGLFYLPRLFVYHSENKDNMGFVKVIKIQEEKLYYYIQNPAMIITVLTGILMLIVHKEILLSHGYIHAKLLFAILLLLYHFDNLRYLKQLKNDTCKKSGKFFRAYNEIPTLLLIGIISMMILTPF